MANGERRKGVEGEREVAEVFRAVGFDCDRTPNSGALRIRGDLHGTVPAHVESKRQETARPWAWWAQATADAEAGDMVVVAFRRSRSPWLALVDLRELARLLAVDAKAKAAEQAASPESTGPCRWWWHRGDQVYYDCVLEHGHPDDHVAVGLSVQPRQGEGEWLRYSETGPPHSRGAAKR